MKMLTSFNHRLLLIVLFFSILMGGCVKKEFDKPPIGNLPVGEVKTIAELISMYDNAAAQDKPIVFDYDASLFAVVSMDETSGNIYKSVFVQDATGAINLRFTGESGLRTGDSIQVYLKKAFLNDYNKLYQIDNLNADSNIVILANKKYPEPETVTIPQLLAGGYQAKLIKLENVQFVAGDLGKNFADAEGYGNRNLEDCNGKTIIVRSSNYASFGDKALPEGKGSLIAIVGQFNTTYQLYVRTLSEVDLTGTRCDGGGGGGGGDLTPVAEVNENFNSVTADQDIAFTGWTNIAEAGTRKWQGKIFSGNGYAQATAYNSGLTSMVSWMITPPVIMDQKKYLRFNTAKAFYAHNDNTGLTVWASTDFDGTNIAGASWTQLNVTVVTEADADHTFIKSGDYDLSPFIGNDYVFIAFKYRGSDTESSSYRVDDVYIGTEPDGGGGGGTGGGTQEEPFTIAQAIENNNATPYVTGWIKGYIVGSVKDGVTQVTSAEDIHFNPPFTLATNLLLADNMNETDYTKCVIVNLPAGSALRTQVNLLDTPGNHKKWLNVTGTLRTYFGQPGLRDCPGTESDFVLEGGGGGGGDALFTEDFATTLGTFSHFSVVGDQIWNWGSFDDGCALMTGFVNPNRIPNEDWLISPAINLASNTQSVLEVRQAANYVENQWDLLQVMISSDYDGSSNPNSQGTWTELTIPNRPPGNNWTFLNSGEIDISAYDGQSAVYVAFRYRSTDSVASTWEISKVEVK